MSIAQGTTHYNYPQVQLNDRPTFADFNPAFEDIDAKLYSLITGASTDHSAIEALQTGLGETNLLLASVKQTADSASGKANTNAENITLLQTGLGNTDRAVANKLDSVAIAEPYDASAGTYNIGDIVVYNGQRYKCTTAVAVAEPFDADKWTGEDVETVLEHLQEEINDIPTSAPTAADVTLAPITGMAADDVQEGIEELKSALSNKVDNSWTLVPGTNIAISAIPGAGISLPSEFHELKVELSTTDKSKAYEFSFISTQLSASSKVYRNGYYIDNLNFSSAYVSVSASKIVSASLYVDGNDVSSTSVIYAWYR